MFRKLRLRFIAIASFAILVVLISIVGVLNSTRYLQTRSEINKILTVLSNNDGTFPSLSEATNELGENTSTDSIFQYRYFSVLIDNDDNIFSINTSSISDLSDEQVENYAQTLNNNRNKNGDFRYQNHTYSYMVTEASNGNNLIVVLDSTNQMADDQTLAQLSFFMSTVSFAFFLIIVTVFSGRVIEPFVQNYEKQRRFITNAGHELKTPLAIISANNELVELMNGESEWTKSTNDQVKRLTGLINGLVALARLDRKSVV